MATGQSLWGGTVFELTAQGIESVLRSFGGGDDGNELIAGLIRDASGDLYGTTEFGGAYLWGTVFELTPHPPAGAIGTSQSLWNFRQQHRRPITSRWPDHG